MGPGAGTVVAIADFKTSDPRWECAASERKDLSCRIPGAALRPGVSLSVEVWIDTRILIIDGNYGFRNCATLSYRDWKRVICATGGSDITVEKTGPAVCIAGGPCTFTVTVSNKGSEPFDGPVLIADSMTVDGAPVNAPITAISPPLGCSPEPTSLPFSCMAQEKLAPGQSDSYSVTIQMPAPGRGYRAQNCVAIFDPLLERDPQLFNATLRPAKAEQPGGQYIGRSCIWIRVQIPLSPPVPGIPLIPNYPQCPDGLTALDNGNCVCALNTLWSAETRSCLPPISVCYDSSRRTPDGQCCPRDSIWNARFGGCERPCYDTSRRTPDGQCCPWGQVWHRETKSCGPTRIHACLDGRPMIAATNTCACPANLRWNWLTKACERPNERSHCTDTARRMPSGQCCPSGTNWDGRSCVRQSCLRGMILLNGKCTIQPNCGSGTRFSPAAGECIAIGTVCRQGAHNVGGNCVPNTFICRHGTHPDGNGHCVADAKVCGKGQRLVGGACVASVQTCGSGTHLIGGKCVPNRQQICRKGQIRTADGGCGSPPPKSETKKSNVKRHTSVDGSDSLKTTGKSGGGSTVKSGKSGGSTKTVSKTGRKAVPKRTENETKKQQ